MNQQDVFEYLKDYLTISIDELSGGNYGYDRHGIIVRLSLKNPVTGKIEIITESSCCIE